MTSLLILWLLVSTLHLQPVDSLEVKDIVDGNVYPNEFEAALQIEIEIPVQDNNESAIQGLLESFFETTKKALPIDQSLFKACIVVKFPKPSSDEHVHAWRCVHVIKPDKDSEAWKRCVKEFVVHRALHSNASGALESEVRTVCQRHGAPELMLILRKVEAADQNEWQQKVQELQKVAAEKKADLMIAASSFGNVAGSPFRIGLYTVDGLVKKHFAEENVPFGEAYEALSSKLRAAVQDLLSLCNYTIVSTACYFYDQSASHKDKHLKTCTLGYSRNGTGFKDPSHQKYCVKNFAFLASESCTNEKCEESCREVLQKDSCDCSAKPPKRRVFVPEKRLRDEERNLWQCRGYGEMVTEACDAEECESVGGIVMIVCGVLILVVVVVIVIVCYLLCFRQRGPSNPQQPLKQPPSAPTPLEPPPVVEGASVNASATRPPTVTSQV